MTGFRGRLIVMEEGVRYAGTEGLLTLEKFRQQMVELVLAGRTLARRAR